MKRESFQGVLLGIVIMCAVFAFITVAWAGLSSQLTISGAATVSAQSWKIGFGTSASSVLASASTLTGSGTAATSPVAISSTTLGAVADSEAEPPVTTPVIASFTAPGQSVSYTWYTVNEGTFAAKATASQNILASNTTAGSNVGLTCTSAAPSTYSNELAQTFCDNYITATLTIDSALVHSGDFTESSTITLAKPSSGSTTSATNVLTITYKDTTPDTALPGAQVNIALTQPIQITYTQA